MEPAPVPSPRPIAEVLGGGAMTGVLAGLATGAIDAIWSWGGAAQFVPGFLARLRFVAFSAILHALAGLAIGLFLAATLLVFSRATRLGDLLRFAWRTHQLRRAKDPRTVMGGLALALALPAVTAAMLIVAFKVVVPFLANRHVIALEVAVAMTATVAALLVAIPLAFVVASVLELVLARIPLRPLSSPYAPLVAIGLLVAGAELVAALASWETARQLPLRGPLVIELGFVLAVPCWRRALTLVALSEIVRPWIRRTTWIAMAPVMLLAILILGNAGVMKAATAYTGNGGPIARSIRRVLDFDRDGYSAFLGGGDCAMFDGSIHPRATEIPDNGVDENCVGGDAHLPAPPHDTAFATVPESVPKDFDVLVITIDTTRADHLGMYGYGRPTSPNLDKLAADGTVFDHAWAHAPSTRYSMPAILTGRYPIDVYFDNHTTCGGWDGILPRATTFAEVLQPLGFATGAITNYEYFQPCRHFDQGFAEYDNSNMRLHNLAPGAGPEQTRGSSSKEQTDKALAFVDKHKDQRWLLWVHYYDPHYAYEPHPEIKGFGTDRMAMYDGELAFTDMHIGRLLDDLRAKGLYDKTVVVVTGDHGEGFGEHAVQPDGGFTHGYHLYTELTKVPLIIKVPGMKGRHAAMPAGHVDILPTLANLAGAPSNPDMMGRSLVDVIGGKESPRVVFQQLEYENDNRQYAGVDDRCHVIYTVGPDTSWEAYRLDRDPGETEDVSSGDDCDDTRAVFEKWYDAWTVAKNAAVDVSVEVTTTRPPIAHPLDADLAGSVMLVGLDVPATIQRGHELALTWTFNPHDKLDVKWKTVFAHLDLNGHWISADHPLPHREAWANGTFVRYTTRAMIPADAQPGRYTVKAGLWNGTKAPATSAGAPIADDEVIAATFEVTP